MSDERTVELEDVACPLCGSRENDELYRAEKHTGTRLGRVPIRVARCTACGFGFNTPRPTRAALADLYAHDALASGATYRGEGDRSYYARLMRERAEFYAPILGAGDRANLRLLDVGCANGGFLRALRAARVAGELAGLEPSRSSAELCRSQGFDVTTARVEDAAFEDASFDAVSLISVLEHLADPRAALERVVRILRPNGIALIEVPNTLHPEPGLTSYFGLEHICHFTPGSLARMLAEVGLTEVRVDDRVRDRGLRAVASASLRAWGIDAPDRFGYDGDALAVAISTYQAAEAGFLGGIEERVGPTLERWRAEGRRIAVYGAGVHTVELDARFPIATFARIVVDGDQRKHGEECAGLPVLPPEALAAYGIDAVLVSSQRFVDEMVETVRTVLGPDALVRTCYEDAHDTPSTAQRLCFPPSAV